MKQPLDRISPLYCSFFLIFCLLLAGSFARAGVIHVPGDQPTIQSGVDAASDGDTVILAPGTYQGDKNRDIWIENKSITLMSEVTPSECIIDCENTARGIAVSNSLDLVIRGISVVNGYYNDAGGGFSCYNSIVLITECIFSDNYAGWDGGGLNLYQSTVTMTFCRISDNVAQANEESAWGGGLFCYESTVLLADCLITGNRCLAHEYWPADGYGGGIGGLGSMINTLQVRNCNILDNHSDGGCGAIDSGIPLIVVNSIIRSNSGSQICCTDEALVRFSNVEGGYTGEGNIDADPLFVSGLPGEYCLSQTAAGQMENSPCIDAGSGLAEDIAVPAIDGWVWMDHLTTRTDAAADTGFVDIGYHYTTQIYVTPTPDVPTQTPTPLPTDTPVACNYPGVELIMPSHCFQANDPCSCKVRVCNPSENPRSDLVLWAVLDLAGQCFFGPSFTGDLDNYLSIYPEFPPGESVLTVFPEFAWPENAGTFDNAIVYAALTGPDGSIAGFWDLWVFGWN